MGKIQMDQSMRASHYDRGNHHGLRKRERK